MSREASNQALLEKVEEKYRSRTAKSKEIYDEAQKHLPGGVSGNAKFLKPYPFYLKSAQGAKIVDVDGNVYIDTLMGGGVHILGHGSPQVVNAVKKQLEMGTNTLVATGPEVELAKKVKKHMPHMEMVRFLNTGSEATTMALRAARAYTKRDRITKFEGNYHGQFDYALISGVTGCTGPETNPEAMPDCAGIPKQILDTVLVLPYNNVEVASSLIKEHAKELAAVIIEPVAMFHAGAIPAERQFMEVLREVTQEEDVIFIFDEVVTGFRLGMGGAAEYFGVKPDISVVGKILGGGFPIGGYGGRNDIMEKVVTPTKQPSDAKEKIFHSGTFTGNPVSVIAGLATLEELEKGKVHPHINSLAVRFADGLRDLSKSLEIDTYISRISSFFHIHFTDIPPRNKRDVMKNTDLMRQRIFSMGMINNDIYLPPAHPGFFSAAHGDEEVEKMLTAAENVLKEIKGS